MNYFDGLPPEVDEVMTSKKQIDPDFCGVLIKKILLRNMFF
ncbi:MAG: hypothetical protein ACO1OT_01235 [Heyndrickxia sp.]